MPENNDAPIEEQEAVEYSEDFSAFLMEKEERIKDVSEKISRFYINASSIGFFEAKKRVIAWLANFDQIEFNDFNIALVLLEQFTFVDSAEMTTKLSMLAKNKNLLSDKMPYTYITHLGEDTESSYRVTSHFNGIQKFLR